MGSSRPDRGEQPESGLRGAVNGEHVSAVVGPVEQHATSEAGRGFGLPREKWSDLRERFWLNMNLGFGGIYEPRKTKTTGTDYQLST